MRTKYSSAWPFAAFLLVLVPGCWGWSSSFTEPPTTVATSGGTPYLIQKDVPVPMRDGVVLRADVLLPQAGGPFPVLVYRTPYGKEFALKEHSTFVRAVERGYAVVVQDVRGRYASEGEFAAYAHEGRDGYDTIEWAASQPWSNGKIGTFGLSYPGAVQWLAAVESPPHLKAMVPAMTYARPQTFFYSGGVFDGSWLSWIFLDIALDVRVRKQLPGPKTDEEADAHWKKEGPRIEGYLPLHDLPDLKQIAPFYYDWLSHPAYDPWWDWADLRGKYGRVKAAVLNLSSWYDEDYGPDGATTNLNGLLTSRKGWGDPATQSIIGPWMHGVEETGIPKAGERGFGATAPINYDETVLSWMDHYLRDVNNGVEKMGRVRLFVMGDNVWRNEQEWPLARTKPLRLYLAESKNSKRSLQATTEQRGTRFSEYVSDPEHPVTDPQGDRLGAHDYRSFEGRQDVLIFDSAPLEHDTEITGESSAEIYLSADVPDTDLWVRLLDVSPDGAAFNLMSPGVDVLRASYRNRSEKRELLRPGEIYRLELTGLGTSNVFKKEHRIRVQISGAFFPHFSRNLQTGELEMTSAKSRVGHIRIYHDRDHPSRITLPGIPR